MGRRAVSALTNERRAPRTLARTAIPVLAGIAVASFSPVATSGVVVGSGSTVDVTIDTDLGHLTMDGGTLRIGSPVVGKALTVSATDAVLNSGYIYNWYCQLCGATINLSGTTSVLGANPAAVPPANGMYMGANPFDAGPLQVVNYGTFVQASNGVITLVGRARFVNQPLAIYDVENDRGMESLNSVETSFLNFGRLWKNGPDIANFNVRFDQAGGQVELYQGQLWFNSGGKHFNSQFVAEFGPPYLPNPGGQIGFDGSHDFIGVTTQNGSFRLADTGIINVTSGTWSQQASFQAGGQIAIEAGATLENSGVLTLGRGAFLTNSGTLTTVSGGVIQGLGTLRNRPGGVFDGDLRSAGVDINTGQAIVMGVENEGTFNVKTSRVVEAGEFFNGAGKLIVDGTLTTLNSGQLVIVGGVLSGSGIINGDVFVGGGPGVASFTPGSSPGTMTINGDFSLLPGGVLDLEVESIGGAISFDRLVVGGGIFLDGQVNLLIGPGVSDSDVRDLFFFTCASGCGIDYGDQFSWSFPGHPGASLVASPFGLRVVTLGAVHAVPEPETWLLLALGLGVIGLMRRRPTGAGQAPAAAVRSTSSAF